MIFLGFLSEQGAGRKIYLQHMQFLTTELLNVVVTEKKTAAQSQIWKMLNSTLSATETVRRHLLLSCLLSKPVQSYSFSYQMQL